DLLAFVGDQFYESTGGYGVVRQPLDTAILDYLRKWYMHGWTWRELTRDRPSLSLPDDHDVYQGNVWGDGGAPKRATQERGGYDIRRRAAQTAGRLRRQRLAADAAQCRPPRDSQGVCRTHRWRPAFAGGRSLWHRRPRRRRRSVRRPGGERRLPALV